MYTETVNGQAGVLRKVRLVTLCGVIALAACHRQDASGQTVATVNGDPITASELKLELAALPRAQQQRMKPQILQSMIERRLLAQEAERQKVDKSPSFVLQERRYREVMLAQQAMQSFARAARQPISQNDISDYLDHHDYIGAKREIFLVDQVQFQAPSEQLINSLKPAKSLDEVISILRQNNISVQRGRGQIDTAALPDDVMSKIQALQPGEPIIAANGPIAVASAIVDKKSAPLGEADQQAVARRRIENDRLQTAVKQRRDSLRQSAEITYAAGYSPTSKPKP